MTVTEAMFAAGLIVQGLGLGIVLFKLVWGTGTNLQIQFAGVTKDFFEKQIRQEETWAGKFDAHAHNFGNVVANINDRLHQIELAAMKARADVAETYMRRESYHQASAELKRDVQTAHADLKKEVHDGFQKLETQVDELTKRVMERSLHALG